MIARRQKPVRKKDIDSFWTLFESAPTGCSGITKNQANQWQLDAPGFAKDCRPTCDGLSGELDDKEHDQICQKNAGRTRQERQAEKRAEPLNAENRLVQTGTGACLQNDDSQGGAELH